MPNGAGKTSVGVLALQGAFAKHSQILTRLGVGVREVRGPEDLPGLDALVIPGGESTTMSTMMLRRALIEPIRALQAGGLPLMGTCAGLILLADRLLHWNAMPRIGGLDVSVARNAYGRQIDSFEARLDINFPDTPEMPMKGVFIRAPLIQADSLGKGVEVLCRFEGSPVLVRQNSIVGASFHPELAGDDRLHRWFLRHVVKLQD